MSPVLQDEQRLRRLKELRAKINHEISELEGELAHQARKQSDRAGLPATRKRKAENRVDKHLEVLGVTAHEVKEWALSAGLIDVIRRGRVKAQLVDAYEAAHTPCTCGTGGSPSLQHADLCPSRRIA